MPTDKELQDLYRRAELAGVLDGDKELRDLTNRASAAGLISGISGEEKDAYRTGKPSSQLQGSAVNLRRSQTNQRTANTNQRTPKLPGVTFRDPQTKKTTGRISPSVSQGDVRQVDRKDEAFIKSLSSMRGQTPEQIRAQDTNAPRFSNKSMGRDIRDMVGAEADSLFMIPEVVRRRMAGDSKGAVKTMQTGLKSAGESVTGRAMGGVLGGSIQQGEGGAASRNFAQGALPGAGGIAGFSALARVGGSLPIANPLLKGAATLGLGMVGAAGGGAAAAGAQRGLSRFLLGEEGLQELDTQSAIDQRDNPLASSIGQASTALLFGKPTAGDVKAIPQIISMVRGGIPLRVALASPAGKMLSETLRERAMEAGVEVLAAAGENLVTGKKMNWQDAGVQALSGALLPGENRLGRVFTGAGSNAASTLGGLLSSQRPLNLDFAGMGDFGMQGNGAMQENGVPSSPVPSFAPAFVPTPSPTRVATPPQFPIPQASPYFMGAQGAQSTPQGTPQAPTRANAPLMLPEAPPVATDVLRGRLQEQQRQLTELLRTGTITPAQPPAPVAPQSPRPTPQTPQYDSLSAMQSASPDFTMPEYVGPSERVAATKTAPAPTQKEPWQMTTAEYKEQRESLARKMGKDASQIAALYPGDSMSAEHANKVLEAARDGEAIPTIVLDSMLIEYVDMVDRIGGVPRGYEHPSVTERSAAIAKDDERRSAAISESLVKQKEKDDALAQKKQQESALAAKKMREEEAARQADIEARRNDSEMQKQDQKLNTDHTKASDAYSMLINQMNNEYAKAIDGVSDNAKIEAIRERLKKKYQPGIKKSVDTLNSIYDSREALQLKMKERGLRTTYLKPRSTVESTPKPAPLSSATPSKGKPKSASNNLSVNPLESAAPNTVYTVIRGNGGEVRTVASASHAGNAADMIAKAEALHKQEFGEVGEFYDPAQKSQVQSFTVVTGSSGKPHFVVRIGGDGKSAGMATIGTPEADAIMGKGVAPKLGTPIDDEQPLVGAGKRMGWTDAQLNEARLEVAPWYADRGISLAADGSRLDVAAETSSKSLPSAAPGKGFASRVAEDATTKDEAPTPAPQKPTTETKATAPSSMPSVPEIPVSVAQRAHEGTSFSPEVRAQAEIQDYQRTLQNDWEYLLKFAETPEELVLLETEFSRYAKGYAAKKLEALRTRSSIYSTMITGPARFPVARMEKRNQVYQARIEAEIEFRNKALASIKKKLTPELAPIMAGDKGAVESLQKQLQDLIDSQESMKVANSIARRYYEVSGGYHSAENRPYSSSLKKGKNEAEYLSEMKAAGFTEAQAKELSEPGTFGNVGFAPFSLSNNNANIARVKGRIKQIQSMKAKGDSEQEWSGGVRVTEDTEDARIRIIFPGKPTAEQIKALKSAGMRWSPSNGAWQRQLNGNGQWAVKRVLEAMGFTNQSTAAPVAEESPKEVEVPAEVRTADTLKEEADAPVKKTSETFTRPEEPVKKTAESMQEGKARDFDAEIKEAQSKMLYISDALSPVSAKAGNARAEYRRLRNTTRQREHSSANAEVYAKEQELKDKQEEARQQVSYLKAEQALSLGDYPFTDSALEAIQASRRSGGRNFDADKSPAWKKASEEIKQYLLDSPEFSDIFTPRAQEIAHAMLLNLEKGQALGRFSDGKLAYILAQYEQATQGQEEIRALQEKAAPLLPSSDSQSQAYWQRLQTIKYKSEDGTAPESVDTVMKESREYLQPKADESQAAQEKIAEQERIGKEQEEDIIKQARLARYEAAESAGKSLTQQDRTRLQNRLVERNKILGRAHDPRAVADDLTLGEQWYRDGKLNKVTGFTDRQAQYFVEKAQELRAEAREKGEPVAGKDMGDDPEKWNYILGNGNVKRSINVPGDGEFSIKIGTDNLDAMIQEVTRAHGYPVASSMNDFDALVRRMSGGKETPRSAAANIRETYGSSDKAAAALVENLAAAKHDGSLRSPSEKFFTEVLGELVGRDEAANLLKPLADIKADSPKKPATKRDQLKAAQSQEAENLKSAVQKAGTRLYSNPLPDPAIISAAGKWLAYEVAIRGIDTAGAFRNQAEAIRTMAEEFGDWVTIHQEKVLESAREFWQSDIVRTLKESKASIPTWIEGEEALGASEPEPEVHHSQVQERDNSGRFVAQETESATNEREQGTNDYETTSQLLQKHESQKSAGESRDNREAQGAPADGDNGRSRPASAPVKAPAPANPNARKLLTIAVQQEIAEELGEDITSRDNLKRTWSDTFVAAAEDFDALRESATAKALSENPGTLSDEERVVAAQLQKTAREKVREMLDKGDLTQEEEASLAVAIADAAIYGRAIVQTGSELGRGLNFSKALMDDAPGGFMRDVERASTLAEGKLSQAQQRALLEVARQGERIQAAVALRLEEKAQASIVEAQEQAREAVQEQGRESASKPARYRRTSANPKSDSYGRDNTVFTKDKYEAALAKLRKENNPTRRGATLNLGISAETVQALMDIGGFHFEAGLRQFSEWSKQVRADVGDVAEAHLQSTWLQVKLDAAKEREGTKSIPAPTNFVEEVAKKLGKEKAFSFLESITDEDGEPEILQKLIDGIELNPAEAKQVRDAWAANAPKRGASAPPSDAMATVRTILEEVKPSRRFARQASAAEIEARQLAKESREARTAEARRQKYEAAQAAMQAAKFYRQEAAGAKRVEAAAQARAKRIEAQAEREAKAQVLAEEKRVEALGNAQEIAEARGQRIRRLREAKKTARALAQEQMQKTAGRRLEEATGERLETMAQTGKAPATRPRTTNPLLDQGVAEYAKGARSLEAFTRGLERRLGESLPEPMLRDLFKEAARRYSVEKGDVQKVKQELTQKINAALLANRPPLYRMASQVLQAKQKLIALKATFDISFLGRQGGKIVTVRPEIGIKAFREGMQALRSPGVALALDGEILAEAEVYGGADHWKKIGLDFTLAYGEENTEAGKLDGPLWTWLKEHGIERSEEANRTILNRLRLDYFKRLVKPGDPVAYQKSMAALVNIMSSRAYMGEGETKGKVTSIVSVAHDYLQVWSPRNNLANLQFIGGTALVKPLVGAATMSDPADRAASLKASGRVMTEYARYAATVGTTLAILSGLAKAFGWDDWMQVDMNPRSKDFGRVRVGQLELDFTSGWRKHWAFLSEVSGARQDSAFDIAARGKDVPPQEWQEPDRGRVLDSYGRSMLNPLAGEALTQFKGRDFKGSPVKVYGLKEDKNGANRPFFNPVQAAVRGSLLIGPIGITNWAQALMEQGSLPKETAAWMAVAMPFEFIGLGASVRDRKPETVSKQREKDAEQRKGFTPASEALRKLIAPTKPAGAKTGATATIEPPIVRNPVTGAYEFKR